MPRAHWKGVISFGLVSIPIILSPIEKKEAEISFHQIDKKDYSRIKYQRINTNTGKVVPWDRITRAYQYDEDTNIPVPDEVLKQVAGEEARTISIDSFIDKDELNIMTITNCYYLVPGKGGDKGYVILRDALKATHQIGIAKVIISTKEYLSAVMPYKNALVLCLLRYHAEMRDLSEIDVPKKELSSYKINNKEMDMAKKLIKSMSTTWRPEKYKDEYQEAIHKWVSETVRHLPHTVKSKKKAAPSTHVVNFVDLLRKSLETNASKAKKVVNHKRVAHRAKKNGNHREVVRHH